MKFDYSKLEGRIVEKFGTRRAFADAWNKHENTVSRKLRGKAPFTTDDIIVVSAPHLLDIPADQAHEYFFTPKVQEVEQEQ